MRKRKNQIKAKTSTGTRVLRKVDSEFEGT